MAAYEITQQYYAKWLGIAPDMLEEKGILLAYNPERNVKPVGYQEVLDIYIYKTEKTIIISYGNRAAEKLLELKEKLRADMSGEEIQSLFTALFSVKVKHNIKYIYKYEKEAGKTGKARRLSEKDCDLYIDFFRTTNPNCGDFSWVKDYFLEISKKGYCHGVIVDNKLVSVTDAPDIPFMSDRLQEIGINTIPAYQGKGYAKASCQLCIKEMFRTNICPLWSTTANNIASQKLACNLGFEKYFDNFSLSL